MGFPRERRLLVLLLLVVANGDTTPLAVGGTCPPGSVPDLGSCFPALLAEQAEAALTGSSLFSSSIGVAPPIETRQQEGSCYALVRHYVKWTTAEQICSSYFGGHLVCIRDEQEAAFLAEWDSLVSWIGLNHRGNRYAFDWSDPQCCSSYRDWKMDTNSDSSDNSNKAHIEPKDDIVGTRYRCAAVELAGKDGLFITEECSSKRSFICEAPVGAVNATACTLCPTGTYAALGDTQCKSCPFGSFNDEPGQGSCEQCGSWSPARLLVDMFGESDTARDGDSLECGGNLGRPQRAAYLTSAVLLGPFAILFALATCFFSLRWANWLDSVGLAVGWARTAAGREFHSTLGALGVLVSLGLASPFFCVFLQPLRQVSQWPYKGRLSPTSEKNGCDPGRTTIVLGFAFAFFLCAFCFFLFAMPFFDPRKTGRLLELMRESVRRKIYQRQRRRLRANLAQQRRLFEREEEQRENLLSSLKSVACTLCRSERATALNEPCSHQFLCLNCAGRFREENGPFCSACREPSTIVTPTRFVAGDSLRQRASMLLHDPNNASSRSLMVAIKATLQTRQGAERHFSLDRCCASCGQLRELVVNMPCGHATVCNECCSTTDNKCLRCNAPSVVMKPVRELLCSICLDSVEAQYLVTLGACGHQLCTGCSIGYVRNALGNVGDHVRSNGIRCPLYNNSGGCESTVTLDIVERLVSRPPRPDYFNDHGNLLLPLAAEEYDRLARFFDEAAVPMMERFYCVYPDCARLFAVANRDALVKYGAGAASPSSSKPAASPMAKPSLSIASSLRARILGAQRPVDSPTAHPAAIAPAPVDAGYSEDEIILLSQRGDEEFEQRRKFGSTLPFATCPFCSRGCCIRCHVAAHPAVPCGSSKEETLTSMFVNATSKPCPQCCLRVTHSHGHACHHIKPGSGCPNCGTHYCYKCLKRGHSGNACGCRLFCLSDDIADHIKLAPYPCDSRCGCTFCPLCRRDVPCEQCDGGCVVCRGLVPPGPSSVEECAAWRLAPPPDEPKSPATATAAAAIAAALLEQHWPAQQPPPPAAQPPAGPG